jgi:AAA+ ATPase superfamily predicted ATPase
MEAPFSFGKIVSGRFFINRKSELEKLDSNFSSLTNTIIISPRRWGKSSLVKRASGMTMSRDRSIKFCFLDLYNIRSEEQLYQNLAQCILAGTTSNADEVLGIGRKYLGRYQPRISFNPDADQSFTLDMDRREVLQQPEDILHLADRIAGDLQLKIILCMDEFQNILGFENPFQLQMKLRSHWQQQEHTSYCIYGSKQHLMMRAFTSADMPFYRFGDILFLQKIPEDEWIQFIREGFSGTRKNISTEDARLITTLTECNSFYVQQLALQAWLRTGQNCSSEIILSAFENLIMNLHLLFQSMTEELSNKQVNFLNALLDQVKQLSAKNILHDYDLGTSANVMRIKQALAGKEIIHIQDDRISFLDPLYKYWLKNHYFRIESVIPEMT